VSVALFPSFWLGGFEASSHVDRSGQRQDFVALTQHDRFVREDYARASAAGLVAVREGVRWHLCDHEGRHDFASFESMLAAAQEAGVRLIPSLFHYGYPDDLHLLHEAFVPCFAAYAAAFARWWRARSDGPRWYVTVNEPSMFAFAAGDAGWFAPFAQGQSGEIKRALIRAAVAAMNAIRAEDPQARFICNDPVVHFVPAADSACVGQDPAAVDEIARRNTAQYEAWDMLAGRLAPELGGGPAYLDVVGVNCYPDQQREWDRPGQLALDDPRRKPFREILLDVHRRYGRPIVISELGARRGERPVWVTTVVEDCLAAIESGVDVQGLCLFPLVDQPEWKHGVLGDWGHLGLWDVVADRGTLRRVLNRPYFTAFERARRRAEASGRLPGAGHTDTGAPL
jgi:beta-glucosidase/6-phospho-beta-glucosidase/beta-galactosidase